MQKIIKDPDKMEAEAKWIALYKDYLKRNQQRPNSVYRLSKFGFTPVSNFYDCFTSLSELETALSKEIFQATEKDILDFAEFENYSARERLLYLYFTLFTYLNAESEWTMPALKSHWHLIRPHTICKSIVHQLLNFVTIHVEKLGVENREIKVRFKLSNYHKNIFQLQGYYLLQFWINDISSEHEKTDEAIEKSTHLLFNLLQSNWVDDGIDFSVFNYRQWF